MAENTINCSKCGKKLAEGRATVKRLMPGEESKNGAIAMKCKCGAINEIDAREKGYIQNQPYQDRLKLIKK